MIVASRARLNATERGESHISQIGDKYVLSDAYSIPVKIVRAQLSTDVDKPHWRLSYFWFIACEKIMRNSFGEVNFSRVQFGFDYVKKFFQHRYPLSIIV